MVDLTSAQALKEQGNAKFKAQSYDEAIQLYGQALDVSTDGGEKAVLYKNRAQCFLKTGDFSSAANDSSKSLDLVPGDCKALFRQVQALDGLGKIEDAWLKAQALVKLDPKNSAIQPFMRKLAAKVQDKIKESGSTERKVTQMLQAVLDTSSDAETRRTAANNIIVLSREEGGAKLLISEGAVPVLIKLFDDKDSGLILAATRALASLAGRDKTWSRDIQLALGMPRCVRVMGAGEEHLSVAAGHLAQVLVNQFTGLEDWRERRDKVKAMRQENPQSAKPVGLMSYDEEQTALVTQFFTLILKAVGNKKVSAHGRDAGLELFMKNFSRTDGLNWTKQLLEGDAISVLLQVAGAVPNRSLLAVTEQSQMHAAVALSRFYEDLVSDKERHSFGDQCEAFLKDLFGDDIMDSKLEAITAISSLLQGPTEVGQSLLGNPGVTEIMMAMAQSNDPTQQRIAVEALVHSASKKEKCAGLMKAGVPILQMLYEDSLSDHIKVRALVGMCKLGSFGGTDASTKPFEEGTTLDLAKSCIRFLSNPSKDADLRRWATEGLAYLSLDAEVKELFVADADAVQGLLQLAARGERTVQYPAASVLVNVTNSYDQEEISPEMLELAKYSKQHIPEKHPKDSEEFVKKRVQALTKLGLVSTLVGLCKADSDGTRELLARVFMAVATFEELRGFVVQQGGAKMLIPLALKENTAVGKALAAQALAKTLVTMNPEVALPGQRVLEAVRPLLQLLEIHQSGLQNFEGLLALTNLTSLNDSVRERIMKEKGLYLIEHYMYEEHELLRRGAVECVCNMVMNDKVYEGYSVGEHEKVKLLMLYCGEEDDWQLVRGAAGALAVLSSHVKTVAKILQLSQWCELLSILCAHERPDIQHRGAHILMNMVASDKEHAAKVMSSPLMEVLMAVSKLEGPERAGARGCAEKALETAQGLGLIQAS